MGYFDFLDTPVSEAEPCGPDLEGQNDFEFALEGANAKLPGSYFDFLNPDKMTDLKPGFNVKEELAPLLGLLRKSHDLRPLVTAARLLILSGDIPGFGEAISAMSRLLSEHWDHVHPQGIESDFGIRESHLALLVDRATVLFPLQFAPLDVSRRHGPLSYRSQILATKAAAPRAKETVLDESTIRDALLGSDNFAGIKERYGNLVALEDDLKAIRSVFIDRAGYERAPRFDDLTAVITPIREFLQGIIHEREPSAVPSMEPAAGGGDATDSAGPPAARVQALASTAEAEAALAAVEAYFSTSEPSNPANLLVRQTQQLVGKSFIEAMLIVSPSLAEKAAIRIGGDMALAISAAQMKALAQQGTKPPTSGETPRPTVANRNDALALMEAVEVYFQRNEPSSPIPLLLGRARSYAGRDFAALMKDMLPG